MRATAVAPGRALHGDFVSLSHTVGAGQKTPVGIDLLSAPYRCWLVSTISTSPHRSHLKVRSSGSPPRLGKVLSSDITEPHAGQGLFLLLLGTVRRRPFLYRTGALLLHNSHTALLRELTTCHHVPSLSRRQRLPPRS